MLELLLSDTDSFYTFRPCLKGNTHCDVGYTYYSNIYWVLYLLQEKVNKGVVMNGGRGQ